MKVTQTELLALNIEKGDRVQVADGAKPYAGCFGLVEFPCPGRPGWFYVRFQNGAVDLFSWFDLFIAPEA